MNRRPVLWLALGMMASLIVVALLPAAAEEPAAPADPGKDLYVKKCAMCHGKDGVANKMGEGSGNFNDPKWQESNAAAAIEKVTAEGAGKMPAYKDKLTPEEIRLVSAYIKTMK